MTAPALFSGHFFSALGWALFHFLWQGAFVAALLAALNVAFRKRAPAARYAVACGALAAMLALPALTAWSLFSSAPNPVDTPAPAARGEVSLAELATRQSIAIADADAFLPPTLRSRIEALRPFALSAWFAGVALLSLRFLGGLAAARRLTRHGARPAPAEWQATLARLAARLSVRRPVRLLESVLTVVPTAIGALRPAILLPASVFTGLPARGLEAILAHELAHIRRHDYLVNLVQTVAETFLFYHPAVWWVSSRVRAEREQCCDDLAIAATGDARVYARALVRLEEMRSGGAAAPAFAVAAGGGNLWKRVVRLLADPPVKDRPSGWLGGAIALSTLFLIGAAARVGPAAVSDLDLGVGPMGSRAEAPDAVVVAAGDRETKAPPREVRAAEPDPDPDPNPESDRETRDAARGAVNDERVLTPDQLVSFRNHGVTAEYVRAIAALGYERADPDDVLALKIHGVTPEAIAEMNSLFGKQPLDEHVGFKIHGLTPEAVRRLSSLVAGKRLSADDALAMRIHGVDSSFVERLRGAGYDRVSADDLVAAKIHGIDPNDAREWQGLGYGRPSLDDLLAARIHGATPEFAREMRSLGLEHVSVDDLVAFRIHGVTADFVRQLTATGLARVSADDAVAIRIHGVTPEFVREIRSLGYSAPSADDVVALKVLGISAETIRKENAKAGRRIPLEDFVEDHDDCGKDDDDEN